MEVVLRDVHEFQWSHAMPRTHGSISGLEGLEGLDVSGGFAKGVPDGGLDPDQDTGLPASAMGGIHAASRSAGSGHVRQPIKRQGARRIQRYIDRWSPFLEPICTSTW